MEPLPVHRYLYRAQMVRVVGGDTVDLSISLDLHQYRLERVRLLGVDAPETRGPTIHAGRAATEWTVEWPMDARGGTVFPLLVESAKADAFGRFLTTIWGTTDRRCLNEDIIAAGHELPW